MQSVIMRYVDDLHAEITATDCSIETAVNKRLAEMPADALFKLRSAAFELERITEIALVFKVGECDVTRRENDNRGDRRRRIRLEH